MVLFNGSSNVNLQQGVNMFIKIALVVVVVLTALVLWRALTVAPKPNTTTKIPYDNGFYAGPYDPSKPKIKP